MSVGHIARQAPASLLLLALLTFSAAPPVRGRLEANVAQGGPVRAWPASEKRFALVIGVDKYTDRQVSPLDGASNDAKTLADALVRYAGFRQEHVILLSTNQTEERQPTRGRILRMMSNLEAVVPKDGLLLISFAGHGIERDGQAFLLPADAEVSDDISLVEETAINVKTVRDRIRSSHLKQVVLILDACRDNPTGRGISAAKAPTELYARDLDFDVRNREVDAFVTLFAASPGETAYEDKEKKQGYFTWALVEGLRGEAANEQGEVTLAGLVKYLEKTVSLRISLDLGIGHSQKPWAEVGGYKADELVIAMAEPKASHPAAVAAATADSRARLYVLAIGVSKYANHGGGLNDLAFAAQDATAFADEIKKQKGGLYSEVVVKTLTDVQATRDEVLNGLGWIQKETEANDVAMIFLAGNGAPDPYHPAELYFLPSDAAVSSLSETAIPFLSFKLAASLLRGRAAIFVDTSHAEAVSGAQTTRGTTGEIIDRILGGDSRVVIFASSGLNEVSMESRKWGGHGIFTKVLLDVLGDRQDGDYKGVTIDALFNRIRERVRIETAFRQNPVLIKSKPDLDFSIVALR